MKSDRSGYAHTQHGNFSWHEIVAACKMNPGAFLQLANSFRREGWDAEIGILKELVESDVEVSSSEIFEAVLRGVKEGLIINIVGSLVQRKGEARGWGGRALWACLGRLVSSRPGEWALNQGVDLVAEGLARVIEDNIRLHIGLRLMGLVA